MIIEMISTGDEVLAGFITNTNASFLAQELLNNGLQISRITTVGDNITDLETSFLDASNRADVVIVNGGLGPTTDDLTTEVVARITNSKLFLNEEALQDLKILLKNRERELNHNNMKQVMLPTDSSIIKNPYGTACGFMKKINNAMFFFTPGVPYEFKHMVCERIIPKIKELFNIENKSFVKIFNIFGITESAIAEEIEKYQIPKNMIIGYRACTGYLEIKIITNNYVEEDYQKTKNIISNIIKPYILCEDKFDITMIFNNKNNNQESVKIAIIDSITNGRILTKMSNAEFDITYIANNRNFSFIDGTLDIHKYEYSIEIESKRNCENANNQCIEIKINNYVDTTKSVQKSYMINNRSKDYISEITSLLIIDLFRRIINNIPIIEYQSIKEIK